MHISIIALGTRGDVQPCVALARGLRAAGYHVRMAADPSYESLIRRHRIDFAPVHANAQAFLQTDVVRTLLERKTTNFSTWRLLGRTIEPSLRQRFADCWDACRDADAIVVSPIGVATGYSIAQKIDCPLIRVLLAPVPPAAMPGPAGRRWLQQTLMQAVWTVFRGATNRARRDVLGLPPLPRLNPFAELDRAGWPVLGAYSRHICPLSRGAPKHVHVTGYWFLDDDRAWQPPAALAQFLAAGPPPVYVGFGSMTDRTPAATTALVTAALARAGERGVLATGWGALAQTMADHVHVIDDAPHDWLFARSHAVVHHGGAGTTAAGLRAGRPTLVVPFGVPDQPFWGERVRTLGVGPRPVARRYLSGDRLAEGIRTLSEDTAMRRRAVALGERIRAEDGVARSIEIVGHVLSRAGRRQLA